MDCLEAEWSISQCMVGREETFTHSMTPRIVAAVTTQSREDIS